MITKPVVLRAQVSVLELGPLQLQVLVHLIPESLELRPVAVPHVLLETERSNVPLLDDLRGGVDVVLGVETPHLVERLHQIPLVRTLERPVLELPFLSGDKHGDDARPRLAVLLVRRLIRDLVLDVAFGILLALWPLVLALERDRAVLLRPSLVHRLPRHQLLLCQKLRRVVHIEQHLVAVPGGHDDDRSLPRDRILALLLAGRRHLPLRAGSRPTAEERLAPQPIRLGHLRQALALVVEERHVRVNAHLQHVLAHRLAVELLLLDVAEPVRGQGHHLLLPLPFLLVHLLRAEKPEDRAEVLVALQDRVPRVQRVHRRFVVRLRHRRVVPLLLLRHDVRGHGDVDLGARVLLAAEVRPEVLAVQRGYVGEFVRDCFLHVLGVLLVGIGGEHAREPPHRLDGEVAPHRLVVCLTLAVERHVVDVDERVIVGRICDCPIDHVVADYLDGIHGP
mmetsp:Transcript_14194/g.60047  ORF Transcript_14194/g.60047 Transcript_14194/m.60047 type:complete len:451 (+) Transcript_14194:28-1380(+)